MFARIYSAGLFGMEGFLAEVEADAAPGLPGFYLTGALARETAEAQQRVMTAIKNSGIRLRPQRITVNISPASVRKEGTAYDLPIIVAVLSACGLCEREALSDTAFLGEAGLDGSLKPVKGVLLLALMLADCGIRRLVLPAENEAEAALSERLSVVGVRTIQETLRLVRGKFSEETVRETAREMRTEAGREVRKTPAVGLQKRTFEGADVERGARGAAEETDTKGNAQIRMRVPDFSEVRGQRYLKRAAEIAVSGRHNILFSGPAGTGKTMIARRMPTIMPPLTHEEDLEISKLYSVCGLLPKGRPLLGARPFRAPHHGITEAAFAGGGMRGLPGEMSLASGGILFLDELPLYSRAVLEAMREPLEAQRVTIARLHGRYTYPADFMLAAACNGCACGYFPDLARCTCTRAQIQAYIGRISKPLMERIDICAEARPLSFRELSGGAEAGTEESSAEIWARVVRAHAVQAARFREHPGIRFNSRMGIAEIERYCKLGKPEARFLQALFAKKQLSGRVYHKVLRVARTIADMEESERIREEHLIEAAELRGLQERMLEAKREVRIGG